MHSGRALAYADDAKRAGGEIVLDEEELAAVRALFPGSKDLLGAAKQEAPRPVRSLKEEAAREAKLSFPSPMLCQAQAGARGLNLLVGLPPEPLPGLEVTVLTAGESLRFSLAVQGLSMAGSFLIDARTYRGPVEQAGALHPDLVAIVLPVYQRFIRGILDHWTSLSRTEGLFAYLLLLLQTPARAGETSDPSWDALRREIRGLKSIPTLGGKSLCLDDLAGRVSAEGELVYAPEPVLPVPEDGLGAPLLRYPRLTAQALGNVRLRKYVPAPPSREPALAEPSGTDETPEKRIVSRLGRIFAELRGTHGIDPQGCPPPEELRFAASGKGLLSHGGWDINPSHPRVAEVLASGLNPEEQADFLASIIYSEANRGMRSITDREDLEFQTALAERLLSEASRTNAVRAEFKEKNS